MVEHINQVMSALAGCVWGHWAWSPAWIHFDAPLAAWRPTHGTTSSNDTATTSAISMSSAEQGAASRAPGSDPLRWQGTDLLPDACVLMVVSGAMLG